MRAGIAVGIVLGIGGLLFLSCDQSRESADPEVAAGISDTAFESFKNWLNDELPVSDRVRFVDFETTLPQNSVFAGQEADSEFGEGYDFTRRENVYVAETDIDGGTPETLVLEHRGSGWVPDFYVLKRDEATGSHKIAAHLERDLFPYFDGKNLYFAEPFRDYDSGRYYEHNVLSMDANFELTQLTKVATRYSYKLDDTLSQYITEAQINGIAAQDYSFLDTAISDSRSIEVSRGGFTVSGEMWYSSVGHMSSNFGSLVVRDTRGELADYGGAWGFNIVEKGDKTYLTILDMDPDLPVSTIEDFRVRVFDLNSGTAVYEKRVAATRTYELIDGAAE